MGSFVQDTLVNSTESVVCSSAIYSLYAYPGNI